MTKITEEFVIISNGLLLYRPGNQLCSKTVVRLSPE